MDRTVSKSKIIKSVGEIDMMVKEKNKASRSTTIISDADSCPNGAWTN